jgi:hypothetical protein
MLLSELDESHDNLVLVIDDLHELTAPEAAGQLTGYCRSHVFLRVLRTHAGRRTGIAGTSCAVTLAAPRTRRCAQCSNAAPG